MEGKLSPGLVVVTSLFVISAILIGSFVVSANFSSFSEENLADDYKGSLRLLPSETSHEEDDEDEEEDVAITGTPLERASAVALDYVGEGRVTDSEVGDEEGYYEIEITLNNGKEVDVHLNENFEVISHEVDDKDDD